MRTVDPMTEDESHYRDGRCIVCGARRGELHSIIETPPLSESEHPMTSAETQELRLVHAVGIARWHLEHPKDSDGDHNLLAAALIETHQRLERDEKAMQRWFRRCRACGSLNRFGATLSLEKARCVWCGASFGEVTNSETLPND